MRVVFQWRVGSRVIELGRRTLIMGIVNVTPDSFSDGGLYIDAGKAVAHAQQLLDDGASIIDIGGESTRPGTPVASVVASIAASNAAPVEAPRSEPLVKKPLSEEEERQRVLPVIRDLKRRCPEAIVSVDTYKASVARAAVEAGADVVNDVGGFRWDSKMAMTLAELEVGAVLMHSRGQPAGWASLP